MKAIKFNGRYLVRFSGAVYISSPINSAAKTEVYRSITPESAIIEHDGYLSFDNFIDYIPVSAEVGRFTFIPLAEEKKNLLRTSITGNSQYNGTGADWWHLFDVPGVTGLPEYLKITAGVKANYADAEFRTVTFQASRFEQLTEYCSFQAGYNQDIITKTLFFSYKENPGMHSWNRSFSSLKTLWIIEPGVHLLNPKCEVYYRNVEL